MTEPKKKGRQPKKTTESVETIREQNPANQDKYKSIEPWVEIVGEGFDPIKGIQIKLDWNDAFVQYLKDNGITGRDEDTIVQKWLAFLYQNLVEKLEQKAENNSDIIKLSDYA